MSRAYGTVGAVRWCLTAGFALLTIYAAVQLYRGIPQSLSWLGLALAAGAPLAGILTHRDTHTRPPVLWTIVSGLGLAVTMAVSYRYGNAAGQTHVWAGGALIAWFAWLRWLRGVFS